MAILKEPQSIDEFIDSINICQWTVTVRPIKQVWQQGSDILNATFGIDTSHWKDVEYIDEAYDKTYTDTYSEYQKEFQRHNDADSKSAPVDIVKEELNKFYGRTVEKHLSFQTDSITFTPQQQQVVKKLMLLGMSTQDVKKYTPGMNLEQLLEIKEGFEKGIDIFQYADKQYNAKQMQELRQGLEKGLDISGYLNQKYNADQMKEIRLGLQDGIDMAKYADEQYPAYLMEMIREGLKNNVDITQNISPETSYKKAQRICKKMIKDPKWKPFSFRNASAQVREDTDRIALEAADQMTEEKKVSDSIKQSITDNKQEPDDTIPQILERIKKIKQQLESVRHDLLADNQLSHKIGDEIDVIITLYDMASDKISEYKEYEKQISEFSDFVTNNEKIQKLNDIVNTALKRADDIPSLADQTEDYLQAFAKRLNDEFMEIDQWIHNEIMEEMRADLQEIEQEIAIQEAFDNAHNVNIRDKIDDDYHDMLEDLGHSDEKTQMIRDLVNDMHEYQIYVDEYSDKDPLTMATQFRESANYMTGLKGRISITISEQKLFTRQELVTEIEKEVKMRYEQTKNKAPSSKEYKALQEIMNNPNAMVDQVLNKNHKKQEHVR